MQSFIAKKSSLTLACLFACFCATNASADIYFSEYVEGSSNNKALEIYNSSETPVNLSGYKVEYYFNGNSTAGLTINLTGTVPAKGVFVILSFNKIEITDSLVKQSVIKLIFNFVSNCCFEFLPGYTVVDNVLSINLEEMNEIGCGCLCCRRYDLQIVDIDAPFSTYKIYIKNKGK